MQLIAEIRTCDAEVISSTDAVWQALKNGISTLCRDARAAIWSVCCRAGISPTVTMRQMRAYRLAPDSAGGRF